MPITKTFSSRQLLAWFAVLAMAISLVLTMRSNYQLRRRLNVLLVETGRLTVKDRTKVNIVEVPSEHEHVWKWRIYAPEGTTCDIGYRTDDVNILFGQLDLSKHRTLGVPLLASDPDGVLITASVAKSVLRDTLQLRIKIDNVSKSVFNINSPPEEWLTKPAMNSYCGRGGTKVCEYEEPIVLFAQMQADATGSASTATPTRGLMFWITPRRPQ